MILLKNRSSFECLRARPELIEGTNGVAVEMVGDFPVVPSPVEAFIGFFCRINHLVGVLTRRD